MLILVAVGANLPGPDGAEPLATCRAAVVALAGLPRLRVAAVSRWYASDPMPRGDQPRYVNGVVRLEGPADPARLLASLHAIEAAAGRSRTIANAARPLDLDLIAMDEAVRDRPDPILPHPRAHLRAFVLVPLVDVAPDWNHPRLGLTARDLLAGLPEQGIEPL